MEESAPHQGHEKNEATKAGMTGFPWFRLMLFTFVLALFGWGTLTGRVNLERGQTTLAHSETIRLIQNEVAFSQKLLAYIEEFKSLDRDVHLSSISAVSDDRKGAGNYLSHPWSDEGIKLQAAKHNDKEILIVYKNLPSDICYRFALAYASQRHLILVNNAPLKIQWDRPQKSNVCESKLNKIIIRSRESWTSSVNI